MKDPLQEYTDWLSKHAVDLNNNLEAVKTWMSIQHTHNDLFLESISELKAEVKLLKKKIEEINER